MFTLIIVLLGLCAIYCASMWAWLGSSVFSAPPAPLSLDRRIEIERQTFHLGLCLVLSLGFLGLLIRS